MKKGSSKRDGEKASHDVRQKIVSSVVTQTNENEKTALQSCHTPRKKKKKRKRKL